jgi:DNA primase large subunit
MRFSKADQKPSSTGATHHYFPTYDEAPDGELSIDQIIELAHHRHLLHEKLKALDSDDLLKIINTIKQMGIPVHYTNDYVRDACPRPKFVSVPPVQFDQLTFFPLLLVSLRDDEARNSFIAQETRIFGARVFDPERESTFSVDQIPQEILELDSGYLDIMSHRTGADVFGFPFELVFPYIDVTRAKVEEGMVVVKGNELRPMFVQFFEKFLRRKVDKYVASGIHEREVFRAVVSLFKDGLEEGRDRPRETWDKVVLGDLDILAGRSFPPCMYAMFTKLRETHKLFHEGRLQFGLFLKGIGLSLDDSLSFWRSELSQLVGDSGFDKQYAYNIRYNYGKEGSAKSRSAYSCVGIIRHPSPAATQTHGCPFMQWDAAQCTAVLESMALKRRTRVDHHLLSSIVDKGRKHPQVACKEWYNVFHKDEPMESPPEQPADWFAASEEAFRRPD